MSVLQLLCKCIGLSCLVAINVAPVEALTPAEIDTAENAAVFVTVQRRMNQQEVTSCGSGFAVHPDGFLVTSSSTVARTVERQTGDDTERIKTEILGVTVFINSGTADEIRLPARILVEDRRLGLALLKVGRAFESPLQVSPLATPQVEDEVTVVGCPIGDWFNASRWFDPSSDPNPKVESSSGSITGFRRSQSSRTSFVETGIEIRPSHLGAPMFNTNGEVIGVVVPNSRGMASAIPLETIRKFIDKNAYKVVFIPPGIDPDLSQMTVDIIPLLGDLDGISGTVCVEGRDLRRTYGRLAGTDFGYRATVRTDDRMFGVSPPDRYDVKIAIRKPGVPAAPDRRFSIPATDTRIVIDHTPDVYKVDPDPHVPGDHEGLSKYAKDLKGEGTSLADAADDSKVRRSTSGSLVIDQNAMSSFVGVSGEAFAELETDEQRALAARFEVVFNEFCNLTSEHAIPIPARGDRMTDDQYRRLISQYRGGVTDSAVVAWAEFLYNIADQADELQSKLRRQKIGKCKDGKWRVNDRSCNVPSPDDCS